jgi:hypothetical protein
MNGGIPLPVRKSRRTGQHLGQALTFANIRADDLEAFNDDGVQERYVRRELPVTMTLDALTVFHAAQQSQDRGCR